MGPIEVARDEHIVPPKGSYELEISGLSEPFMMTFEGQESQRVRVEYLILNGPGKDKRFNQLYGFSIGPRSTLGQSIAAVRGTPLRLGEPFELTDIIGLRFKAFVGHAVSKQTGQVKADPATGKPLYAEIALGTIEPAAIAAMGDAADDASVWG